jgi:SAM-dependent methyltransferase
VTDAPTYTDGRLHAPAAARNVDALCAALSSLAPASGNALEIASGTGQHVIRFAAALPGLIWHPSDPDPARRASITAWTQTASPANIASPIDLDVCTPGWAKGQQYDFIFLANLLHLVPAKAAQTCLTEMAHALKPGGRAVVYGPFLRDGKTTSQGDAEFHARLQVENPGAGYKDLMWVYAIWASAGLIAAAPHDMPANNLLLVADKSL